MVPLVWGVIVTDRLSIDFARMDQLQEIIGDANNSISASLDHLDDQVRTLKGEWSGEASEAYESAHAKWLKTISDMNSILSRIHSATGSITALHRSAERDVKQLWS